MNQFTVSKIQDVESFRLLKNDWNQVLEKADSGSIFLTHEWQYGWWNAFGTGKELNILTVTRGAILVGVAPLMISKKGPIRIVEFVGTGLSDYLDFIISDPDQEAVLSSIFNYMYKDKSRWDVISLQSLDARNKTSEKISSAGTNFQLLTTKRLYTIAPYVKIMSTWPEFLRSKNSQFRENLKKWERRTEKYGKCEVKRLTKDEIDEGLIDKLWEIEKASWKFQAGTALLRDTARRRFYQHVVEEFATSNRVQVSLLLVDLCPVSFQISFFFRNKVFMYSCAYDMRYPHTGSYLIAKVIQNSFDRGFSECDFMQGAESYKNVWTSVWSEVDQVVFYKQSLYSICCYLLAFKARWLLARWKAAHELSALVFRMRHWLMTVWRGR